MFDIVIDLLENTSVTYEQITNLMHDSFQERLEQGLKYSCSSITPDEFVNKTKGGKIFVALDKNTEDLLGVAAVVFIEAKNGRKYAYNAYEAISNKAKRCNIGTRLFAYVRSSAEDNGCEYIMSDTSVLAKSAVDFHLSVGFKIVAYESFRSTNYWSYVFRLQLKSPSLWDLSFYRYIRFFVSFCFIKLTRTVDGKDSSFGKIYKSIVCRNYL